jgi:hypothetical protein
VKEIAAMERKPWYLSRTIWGAAVALLGVIFPRAVAALGGDAATDNVLVIAGSIAALAGSILAIYGRVKASTTIGPPGSS